MHGILYSKEKLNKPPFEKKNKMTLIVGIKCRDGIVIGADSAASFMGEGDSLTRQAARKLVVFDNKIIAGIQGAAGLGQQIIDGIGKLHDREDLSNKEPFEASKLIREEIWIHAEKEFDLIASARQSFGIESDIVKNSLAQTIIATPSGIHAGLFQFDVKGTLVLNATEDLPFIVIGAGDQPAEPFLAFLRRTIWPNSIPDLNLGIFTTIWTLKHAIKIDPRYIGVPLQIAILKKEESDWEARELNKEEIKKFCATVSDAETHIGEFKLENLLED